MIGNRNSAGLPMSIRPIIAVFIAFPLAASCLAGSLSTLAQGNIKSSKTEVDELYAEAWRLRQHNQLVKALQHLESAIALAPERPELHTTKARWFLQLGRARDAHQEMVKIIRIFPKNAEAHAAMADVLFQLKRPAHALREAEQAVALSPNCVQYRDLKCGFLYHLRRLDAALAESEKALLLDPKYAHIYNNRAYILVLMNRHEEALAAISKAIELDPQVDYLAYRALILVNLERPAEAEKEILVALKSAPGDLTKIQTLIMSLTKQKKLAEAKAIALRLLSDKSKRPTDDFICWMAHDQVSAGGWTEAIQILDYAIRTSQSKNTDMLVCRIGVYCCSGNSANALKDTRIFLEKSSDPINDSLKILGTMKTYSVTTVANSQCLSEVARILLQRHLANSSEQAKITKIVRTLGLEQDQILTGLCDNCAREKQAFQLLNEIASIQQRRPLSKGLYYAFARMQIRSANITQAFVCVREGLKHYPKSISLLELCASLNTALGRKQEAQGDVEKIQHEGRDSYTTHIATKQSNSLVTQLSAFINDDAEAVHEVVQRAMTAQRERLLSAKDVQTRSDSLLQLAELEIAEKRYSDALKHIDESVKLTGKSAMSCEVSSWALEGLGRRKEASEARSQAVILYHQR